MTDTPTGTPTGDEVQEPGIGPDVPADQPIAINETVGTGAQKPIKDRFLLPLLVPVLSAIAVGVLAVNISRVFLAGDSDAALFVAIFVTLAILGGASLLAAAPHMRTSSLAMVTGLIIVIVMGAGLLTLGQSLGHDVAVAACTAPSGAAVGNLDVHGSADDQVQRDELRRAAGRHRREVLGRAGTHTLAFQQPNVLCVQLGTPGPPSDEKVLLKAGQTYTIYCTVPGHEAAGMKATVTVAAS